MAAKNAVITAHDRVVGEKEELSRQLEFVKKELIERENREAGPIDRELFDKVFRRAMRLAGLMPEVEEKVKEALELAFDIATDEL